MDEETLKLQRFSGYSSRPAFLGWLFCLCFSLAGVQFVYSIQFSSGTPLFYHQLKVPVSIVSIILSTAGPISGFIVQPIVGVISDFSESRFGRRRPFIFFGTIFCVVGMAMVGNSVLLGNWLGDTPNGETMHDHYRALIFAIAGLWLMNLCVNIIQGPSRAIVADLVSQEEQQTGNAMVSNVMGISAIIASVVGAQFFETSDPYFWLFMIGVAVVLFSIVPTMIAAKEKRFTRPTGSPKPSLLSVFVKIGRGFRYMPGSMAKTALLYFFSWCAYSPFMIYLTQYFSSNVYAHQGANYGVKMGMYALAGFAGVCTIYSLLLPPLIRLTNIHVCYFFSQLLATACYVMFLFFDTPVMAFVLTSLVGINYTTFNSIPFALVTSAADPSDAGLFMGVLNSGSVVAQTVTNIIAGQIVAAKHQNVQWGIAFGSVFSVLAMIMVFFLPSQGTTMRTDLSETSPLMNEKIQTEDTNDYNNNPHYY
eukprot:TRINITY_DN6349_c0_g1_i1.p1 TRINITY_DN6349_c0_g1~~TRINITY_DN6349_c0_g1_i1.p1  ORF type:complete len:478 (-),score=90.73 TRINITY_DN6349_c0_g1_i1:14-1447(-)